MFRSHLLRNLPRCVDDPRTFSTLVRDGRQIRCCGALYKSWHELNLKPYLPRPKKPDLRLRLEYLRTPKQTGKLTVVAFHGSPGSAEHFRTLGDTMHERCGADFIIPSFPDISLTLRTGEYFHSAEEKVEIVEALLEQLDVPEVDLVVAHSAGICLDETVDCFYSSLAHFFTQCDRRLSISGSHAALLMTLNQKKIRIRSIAVLCSTSLELIPAFRPPWLHSSLVALLHKPVLKKLVVPSYKLIALSLGMKKMTAAEAATSLTSVYATRYWYPDRSPKWIKELRERDFPRMAMYSSKDSVIPAKLSEAFVRELGNPDKTNHFAYSGRTEADLRLAHKPLGRNLPPVVQFIDGGHNVMKQFPSTVADHLLRDPPISSLPRNRSKYSVWWSYNGHLPETSGNTSARRRTDLLRILMAYF